MPAQLIISVRRRRNDYYSFGFEHNGLWKLAETYSPANRYGYNGKEMTKEMELGLYDYGARWYDPVVGRFNTLDRFAEKYSFQSPYAYAANNPVKFIDVNGDSIWITTIAGAGKNGNDLVNVNVSGTVIDNTRKGLTIKQLEKKRQQIIKGIERSFKGSGEGIEFKANVSISVSPNEAAILSNDHVFRFVDDVAVTKGIAMLPGIDLIGEAAPFENIIYLDSDLSGLALQRTAAHELGHSAGLPHIKDDVEISPTSLFRPLTVLDYPTNLMHQSRDVSSPGFRIESFQIRKIKKFYDAGLLNRGKQN